VSGTATLVKLPFKAKVQSFVAFSMRCSRRSTEGARSDFVCTGAGEPDQAGLFRYDHLCQFLDLSQSTGIHVVVRNDKVTGFYGAQVI